MGKDMGRASLSLCTQCPGKPRASQHKTPVYLHILSLLQGHSRGDMVTLLHGQAANQDNHVSHSDSGESPGAW